MSVEVSYSEARNNLASILDQVTDDREVVIIKRRGRSSVAMIDADELSSILASSHILGSPRNVERLESAIKDIADGKGEITTADLLREEFGVRSRSRK